MDNTISRDGTTPNQMEASFDLNDNRIINVAAPVDDNDVVRKIDIAGLPTVVSDATEALEDAQEALDAANNMINSKVGVAANGTDFADPGAVLDNLTILQAGTGAVEQSASNKLLRTLDLMDFIPETEHAAIRAGTSTYDAYPDIIAAFEYANSLQRTSLAGIHIKHPGARLEIPAGRYKLTSAVEEIPVECDVVDRGATFVFPAEFDGTGVRVGLDTSGDVLTSAYIALPDITKEAGWSIEPGSIGVKFKHLYSSVVSTRTVEYFASPWACRSAGFGFAYNTVFLGRCSTGVTYLDLVPESGGWCNSNTFVGGNYFMGGFRESGQSFVKMDGTTGGSEVIGNRFIGFAFEGPGAEYAVIGKNAVQNNFYSPYIETGSAPISVTVSGDTLTKTGHGLSVGEMITLTATVMPTGMIDSVPYYVTTVATDTFSVSLNKGGTSVTFSSAGTAVQYYRHMRMMWDGSGGANTHENVIFNQSGPLISQVDHVQSGLAHNNGAQNVALKITSNYSPEDFPSFRGRNFFDDTSITRASFAAYPPTVDPATAPTLWTVGLSDRGLVGKNTDGSVSGRISFSGGILYYEPSAGGVTRQIASCSRTLGGPETLGSASVPANDELIVTHSLVNTLSPVTLGDHLTIGWLANFPTGIIVSWSRVSASNVIKICFRNVTGSSIDLTGTQFTAICTAQYF